MTPTPPPLLPATALDRVGKLARFDGLTVLAVAGCFATVSLAMRDWAGAAICFGAVGAGASEWRGGTLLKAHQPRSLRWLVASQLSLLGLVWLYAAWRYTHYNPQLISALVEPFVRERLEEAFLTMDDLAPALEFAHRLTYLLLATLSLAYQGGLAWYYARQQSVLAKLRESAL